MPSRAFLLLVVLTAMSLLACERKALSTVTPPPSETPAEKSEISRTQDSKALAQAVETYARTQNPENDAAVRKAMADVDSELAELEELVAKRHGREREKVAVKLRRLEAYRSEQTTRFAEAQAGTGLTTPEPRIPTTESSSTR